MKKRTTPESWRYSYIDSILSDDKGYVYTYDYQTVNIYGPDGSFVFSKSGDELNGQICQLSASEVGMTTLLRRRQDGLQAA